MSKSTLIIIIIVDQNVTQKERFFYICEGCHISNYSLFGSVVSVRGSSQSSCYQCSFSFDRSQTKYQKYKEDISERCETYQLWLLINKLNLTFLKLTNASFTVFEN